MLFAVLEILVLFSSVHSFSCSSGSEQFPQENKCLYTIGENQFYSGALRDCFKKGGSVVKIGNALENSFTFIKLAQSNFSQISPYIGVERSPNGNGTWIYSDGTPLTYSNWAQDEPKLGNVCVVMDPSNGQWKTSDCSVARPYFCSSETEKTPTCSPGWKYFNETGFCYYLQDFTYSDGIHWQLYNWTTAESLCQGMKAHLVSIHSKAEDDFVFDLIASNVANDTTAAGLPCNWQWAWIGYYGQGILGDNSTWTDRTRMDYNGYMWGAVSSPSFWVMGNDQSCFYPKYWVPLSSNGRDPYARFVCKIKP
ncbi:unnamed protein product, partial [Mesorhabditis belari]|uniref:C-type lectin domain-containing protein n=1 Tax=Mesorhabditis belari TaxID=2138241 RepID=A0AAF3EIK8_9BILA